MAAQHHLRAFKADLAGEMTGEPRRQHHARLVLIGVHEQVGARPPDSNHLEIDRCEQLGELGWTRLITGGEQLLEAEDVGRKDITDLQPQSVRCNLVDQHLVEAVPSRTAPLE